MPVVTSSREAYSVIMDSWQQESLELFERFRVLLMNTGNRVMGVYEASSGGISGTVVDIRLLMITALKATATGIIVFHNHPSGNLKPSTEDRKLTQRIHQAATYLDIKLHDHLIVGKEGYLSFRDEGLL
ncbi:JAB domain-containing protein [Sphingobacterium hotanense]|uniref:JAB domain-containing protein n=1 Tax=Sphingobacterium hotanense TaxID=649196 RepID=UPI001FE4A46E|nr:JAB domain-containing protein [Sphingobacterium hotanense]